MLQELRALSDPLTPIVMESHAATLASPVLDGPMQSDACDTPYGLEGLLTRCANRSLEHEPFETAISSDIVEDAAENAPPSNLVTTRLNDKGELHRNNPHRPTIAQDVCLRCYTGCRESDHSPPEVHLAG